MTYLTFSLAQENQQPAADPAVNHAAPAMTAANHQGVSTAPQTTTGESSKPLGPRTAKGVKGPFGDGQFFIVLLVLMGVMIFMTFRSQSKEKKKRAKLIASLSKGDKIRTIGGITGNIVELRDDFVVVKVDENNNTRIKFTRSAIQGKIDDPEN